MEVIDHTFTFSKFSAFSCKVGGEKARSVSLTLIKPVAGAGKLGVCTGDSRSCCYSSGG